MNKHLILARHSLPEIQRDQPAREWKLSAEGRLRARRLAERLSSYPVETIFTSEEPKALETAQIIAATCRAQLRAVKGLQEHDRSNVSYLSRPELEMSVQVFFSQPDTLVFGRETANQVHARFSKAINSILEKQRDQTPLIVAHGTVISLLVSRFTGISAFSIWKQLGLPSFVIINLHSKRLITIENRT